MFNLLYILSLLLAFQPFVRSQTLQLPLVSDDNSTNITCSSSQDCTILCGDGGYLDCVNVYIKCYGTCVLNCREDDVCSYAYVDASEAQYLTLNCRGNRACESMTVLGPTEKITMRDNNLRAFASCTIHATNTREIDLVSQGTNACFNLTINGPINVANSSMSLVSIGSGGFNQANLNISSVGDFYIECDRQSSCVETKIIGYNNKFIDIYCEDNQPSCVRSIFEFYNADEVLIRCRSCQDVYINANSSKSVTLDCANNAFSAACANSTFVCPSDPANECKINCKGSDSCEDLVVVSHSKNDGFKDGNILFNCDSNKCGFCSDILLYCPYLDSSIFFNESSYCITECDSTDLLVDSNVNCIDETNICGYKTTATRSPSSVTNIPTMNPSTITDTPSVYPTTTPIETTTTTSSPTNSPTNTKNSSNGKSNSSEDDATLAISLGITIPLVVIILVAVGYWIYKTKYSYGVIYKGSGIEIQRITEGDLGETVR